jgi:hypothetical protein
MGKSIHHGRHWEMILIYSSRLVSVSSCTLLAYTIDTSGFEVPNKHLVIKSIDSGQKRY